MPPVAEWYSGPLQCHTQALYVGGAIRVEDFVRTD